MKLKNKKTGEITDYKDFEYDLLSTYSSLAELNEEWEDYEEPKGWWYIDCNGEVFRGENADKEHTEEHKSIGNYYTSSKEAEKAVEKLKAWKRLKDKGFRFVGRSIRDLTITYSFDNYDEPDIPQMNKDLDLLFGDEE